MCARLFYGGVPGVTCPSPAPLAAGRAAPSPPPAVRSPPPRQRVLRALSPTTAHFSATPRHAPAPHMSSTVATAHSPPLPGPHTLRSHTGDEDGVSCHPFNPAPSSSAASPQRAPYSPEPYKAADFPVSRPVTPPYHAPISLPHITPLYHSPASRHCITPPFHSPHHVPISRPRITSALWQGVVGWPGTISVVEFAPRRSAAPEVPRTARVEHGGTAAHVPAGHHGTAAHVCAGACARGTP
jgi:hypothetical protein